MRAKRSDQRIFAFAALGRAAFFAGLAFLIGLAASSAIASAEARAPNLALMSSGQPLPAAMEALNSSRRSAGSVVRHLGKPLQLMKGPRLPWRTTMFFLPHLGQSNPVSTGGGFGGSGSPVFLSMDWSVLHSG